MTESIIDQIFLINRIQFYQTLFALNKTMCQS